MVARTPPKQKKALAAFNPVLIRETLNKVDRCVARLQELQYTVAGGNKVVSGVSLSPRSTRGYLRTSIRCKQESVRIKNGSTRKSPVGKFPFPANTGEWKRMSLPAMLVGETIGEILQASQFAREIVSAVTKKTATEDPKTPLSQRTNQKKEHPENTELKARRKKEKQTKLQNDASPSLKRARSRINFKVSPPKVREFDKENNRYLANRVSPRNRPWARKTVLFPNPLFLPNQSSQQQQFCKTRSPIISRNRGTPHKFLIKSPPSTSKFQVKIKSPPVKSISPTRPTSVSRSSPKRSAATKFHLFHPPTVSVSPTRLTSLSRSSPKRSGASKFRSSFSPSRLATKLVSQVVSNAPKRPLSLSKSSPKRSAASKFHVFHPTTVSISPTRPTSFCSVKRSAASKFRRSFSPSRLATRLVSPLKSKKTVQKSDGLVSGLKQRPASTVQFAVGRI